MDLTNIKTAVSKIKDLQTALKDEAAQQLELVYKEIFNKYPNLNSLSWKQYTCFFADGDPVYFSVYSDLDYGLELNGTTLEDAFKYDHDWTTDMYTLKEVNEDCGLTLEEFVGAGRDLNEVLMEIPYDTMLDIYGDHVQVVITRTGTQTEEFTSHD